MSCLLLTYFSFSLCIFFICCRLYDPYVRGAEFWQVHDVLMKMVLTGMLIYIPSASRAGIAALLCVVACCNLNYFVRRILCGDFDFFLFRLKRLKGILSNLIFFSFTFLIYTATAQESSIVLVESNLIHYYGFEICYGIVAIGRYRH